MPFHPPMRENDVFTQVIGNSSRWSGMTSIDPTRETRRPHRRGFRLTSRVFWDMAIYMVGLGLIMGVIFPPFVVLLGVPDTIAGRPIFRLACLLAGFLVGAMNYALVKGVVGGRLTLLGGHLRSATDSITTATKSGDWSEAVFERITVDSHDQIGDAGLAFNSLLGAVEGRKDLEERLRYAGTPRRPPPPTGSRWAR